MSTPDPAHGRLVTDDLGRVVCHECGRAYRSLPAHITRTHGLDVDAYRDRHGLARTLPLVSDDTRHALHRSGVRRRDEDPRVLETLTSPAPQAQRRAPFPRAAAPRAASTRARTAAAKRERDAAALAAKLDEHGWASLEEAVEATRAAGGTWSSLAGALGMSQTPLQRLGSRQGLYLETRWSDADQTEQMLQDARTHAATHGGLAGTTGPLARWLTQRRYLAARQTTPSAVTSALDDIDPTWRHPRRRAAPSRAAERVRALEEHLAAGGTLRDLPPGLGRWLSQRRYQARTERHPSPTTRALDELTPGWRHAGRAIEVREGAGRGS